MTAVSPETFGLPAKNFAKWMDDATTAPIPKTEPTPLKPPKNPEIPVLDDYRTSPPTEFWDIFPSCPLPTPDTKLTEVDTEVFDYYADLVGPHLSPDQKEIFETVAHSLKYG